MNWKHPLVVALTSGLVVAMLVGIMGFASGHFGQITQNMHSIALLNAELEARTEKNAMHVAALDAEIQQVDLEVRNLDVLNRKQRENLVEIKTILRAICSASPSCVVDNGR